MSYIEDEEDLTTLDHGNDFEEDQEEIDTENKEDETSSEDEDDETSEEDEDDEIEEEIVQKKESPRIPKERLDKALRRRDESRERNLWLEEQLEKLIEMNSKQNYQSPKESSVPVYDFDSAEESYANLLIEGDIAKATKLRKEIDNERQKEIKALIADIKNSSIEEATNKASAAADTREFTLLVQNYENKFPFLDTESDDYNEDAVETVNTLLSGYLSKGFTKSQSLKKAVEKIAPMFSKEKLEAKGKSLSKERMIEAGKKATQAAKTQPSKTRSSSSSTIDNTKLDVSKMTEKDFNKLTPKELKLLRGD